VLILDFASRTVRAVGSHTSAVSALAWDERATLFSGAHDATFSAWDLDAGEQRFGYEGHTMKVYALCYAAGMIYTGSKDSTVKSWDVAALARGAPKLRLASTVVQTLAVSPDGRFVTYSDTEDQILIQPTSDLSALASAPTPVRAHRGKILALAFDEKSERLASIGADGMLKVWRIAGEPTLEKRIGFGRTERDFEARIDFATATGVIWNTELFELIRWERSNSFEAIPIDFKGTVALCPDGRHVLGSIEDVGLALVDLDREKVVQVLRPASKPRDDSERAQMEAFTENWLNIATVSASGGVALTACSGRITRWRLSDGAPMAGAVPEHIAHIHGLAVIEPLHAGLSIGLEDRELRLWSLDDGTLLCRFVADGGWWASDVSRDGRVIVASNEEGLMVFDVVGGARA
jgi:WD40 repeat protein